MKNLKLTKALLATCALAALAFNLTAQSMALEGKLKSSRGTPVSGAEVSIFDAADGTLVHTCYSDAQGFFASEQVLRPGQRIRVEIAAEGFEVFKKAYTINTGKTGWITMTPATALSGRVRSSRGPAVADAAVSIFDKQGTLLDRCYSNARGEFASKNMLRKGQEITVEVQAEGFNLFKRDYTINTGKTGWITLTPGASEPVESTTRPNGSDGRSVSIKGTVKSDQVQFLKDVIVSFYYPGQEKPEDNDITDEKGQFQSEKKFKRGDKVIVVAKKINYSEEAQTIEIDGAGDFTVNFVLKTRTYIAGFVAYGRTGQFLEDVQISYQSREGPFNTAIRTNQSGYFDFDVPAPFKPGDAITVRVEKDSFVPAEIKQTITSAENRINFLIVKWRDQGIDLGIRVTNKKGKPMRDVEINYFDIDTVKVRTPENGVQLLNIKKAPGDLVQFDLIKSGYKVETREHTLRKDLQYINFTMVRDRSKCPCWLFAGLGLAAGSGASYLLYDAAYKDYDNPKSQNRENDYNKATTWLRAGTISGGLAIGALTGWVICLNKERKKYREAAEKRRLGFAPLLQPDGASQSIQIGIAYTF